MNHLIYVKPSGKVLDYIKSQQFTPPPGGFHSTLLVFRPNEEFPTGELAERLRTLRFAPFEMSVRDYGFFDKGANVLRLNGKRVNDLHHKVVGVVKGMPHLGSSFEENLKKYFLENYRPHITVAYSGRDFIPPELPEDPLTMSVSSFHLARLEGDAYRVIEDFKI